MAMARTLIGRSCRTERFGGGALRLVAGARVVVAAGALSVVAAVSGAAWADVARASPPAQAPTATPERAEAAGLTVEAHPLFDGWLDAGRWLPLVVDLENAGDDLDVELRVSSSGAAATFVVPVELPRGGAKRVPVMALPGSARRLSLRVVAGGALLAERRIGAVNDTTGEALVVVLADEVVDLGRVEAVAQTARPIVVRAAAAEIPEHVLGWGSVDHVVLAGADLGRAGEAQRRALAQWVAFGGQLIVAGGPGAAAALDDLPEALRAAEVAGARQSGDLGALAGAPGDGGPVGSVPIAVLRPAEGAVVETALPDGAPLVVRRGYGEGEVWLLAFDPSLPPLNAWGGLPEWWETIGRPPAGRMWTTPVPDPSRLGAGLGGLPEFELPSMSGLMLLIAVYIVLVGPVNYLVLRRRRRLDLAWVTIPALTLLATGATYGAGYVIHGRDLVVYQLSAVHVVPEADLAYVRAYVGLFSPGSRAYDVRVPGALARPVGEEIVAVQGAGGGVRGFGVDQWSIGAFAAEAVVDWPAEEPGTIEVRGTAAAGEVRNPFGDTIVDAMLLAPGGLFTIGELAPSEARDVATALVRADTPAQPRFGVDAEVQTLRAGMVAAALGSAGGDPRFGGPFGPQAWLTMGDRLLRGDRGILMGWTRGVAPLAVEVVDRRPARRVHTFLYASVPQSFDAGMPRTIDGLAVERSDTSDVYCPPNGALFDSRAMGGAGSDIVAVFVFRLPEQIAMTDTLKLALGGPSASAPAGGPYSAPVTMLSEASVGIAGGASDEWLDIGTHQGDDTIDLPPPGQWPGAEAGELRVRLGPVGLENNYFEPMTEACWTPRLVWARPTGRASEP